MRIFKFKTLSLAIQLALAALFAGHAQAQEVPPLVGQAEATSEDGPPVPPRPAKTILPSLKVLSGPLAVWTNKPEDGFQYVGFVLSNTTSTFSSGYGNITSGPVQKALVCFSNLTRAENGQIILRVGTPQGIYFPLAVKLAQGGFIVTDLGDKVSLKDKLTGEVYKKGSKILYLLTGLNFSSFVEIDFGEELDPVQVLIELGESKTDISLNFLQVNDPNPQPRPTPPTRP